MTEPRIIKKYPNRRLYDTRESRYITLGDICRLVIEHESSVPASMAGQLKSPRV